MKKSVLREYAKLIAKTGVNVQKGQEVFITGGSSTSRSSLRWWSTSATS